MNYLLLLLIFISPLGFEPLLGAEKNRVVAYELVATQGRLNLSGKKTVDFALLVNGSLPAPTLEFTEGDEAVITLKNEVPGQEVSIHWHGILLPPEMDGVPYVNTPPIPSGGSFTYRFSLRQSGTYWYHTHTNVQEQKGLYGAFIVHPKKPRITADREAVLVLSDWSDEDATQILANLRKDGDYYLYKKGTMRSWWGAIREKALGVYLDNEWTRMGGMDYSDVGYDAFLINGKRELQLLEAHPGEKIRLRLINAAASSYFHLALGDRPMQVIAVDGVDMKPVLAREILIGMAETYDVLFEVPAHKNYELRATAQDGTGFASAWIGVGEKVPAPVKPMPPLYEAMNHGPADAHAGHEGHAMQEADPHAGHRMKEEAADPHAGHRAKPGDASVVPTLTVDDVQALEPTVFSKDLPIHDVKLVLDGDMERYVWHINGRAIFEDRNIVIQEGQVIRFTMVNETMMHHPMHLHGHFFRVLNKFGDLSPWKHTVDVSPHSTRTIEFMADEPGEWMLHCHNLYHMKTGMARVVKYSSFTPARTLQQHQKHDPHNHDHSYVYGMLEAATNHGQARFRLSQTWNEIEARVETDYRTEVEGDLFYRRWRDRYLNFILGASYFHEKTHGVVGFSYLLPMLVESQLLVDHRGKLRLDLDKRFQWTSTIFSDADISLRQSEKTEWELSLMYASSWSWALGLKLTEEDAGLGLQLQF